MRQPGNLAVLAVLAASSVWTQDIVSVRSGLIHHIEGDVTLKGEPVTLGKARFPTMGLNEVLAVERGYAEILLTPGAFLRVDRGASVQLTANELDDTRLELLHGTALVEVDELLKGNRISVTVSGVQTVLLKNGLYSFDAEVGRLRVFDGKAEVSDGGIPVELGKGRTMLLSSIVTKPEKFSTKDSKDALYAWSQQRATRLAVANISASSQSGATRIRSSFWAFDPWMNMYTFMPRSGFVSSAFGGYFYNPQTVWVVFQPQSYGGGNPASNAGGNPGSASSPAAAAAVPSGPASSGDGGGGIRTRASDAAVAVPAAPQNTSAPVRTR